MNIKGSKATKWIVKFRKPLIALVIVAVSVTGIVLWQQKKKKANEAPMNIASVERRDIILTVTATGTLEPLTTVDVKSNVAGEITELAVDRGDVVKQGDLIARIDPTETRTAYEKARADLTSAEAKIRQSQSDYLRQRGSTDGSARVAEVGINSASAKVDQARANLDHQLKSTVSDIRRAEEALLSAKAKLNQSETKANVQPKLTKATITKAENELVASRQALTRLNSATHPQEVSATRAKVIASKTALANQQKTVDRLAVLYKRGGVSQQEYESAQTALANARDNYENANATQETLEIKQQTEIAEAEAKIRQSQASLDSARAGEADIKIAQQELLSSKAAVREAEAALAAAKASRSLDVVRAKDVALAKVGSQEARAQLTVANANRLSAQSALHQITQSQADTTRANATVESAAKDLTYTTITAPRDGVVIDRYVEEGTVTNSARSSFSDNNGLVTIADISQMFVLAEVDESDIGGIKAGQKATVNVETFPDVDFPGEVVQVYPKGEEVDNVMVFKVRIRIENAKQLLRPGMTADISIILEEHKNVLAVPAQAVYKQEGNNLTDVMRNGAPEPIAVKTGVSDLEWIEITEGLIEGDQVVLDSSLGLTQTGGKEGPPGGKNDNKRMMRMMGGKK